MFNRSYSCGRTYTNDKFYSYNAIYYHAYFRGHVNYFHGSERPRMFRIIDPRNSNGPRKFLSFRVSFTSALGIFREIITYHN